MPCRRTLLVFLAVHLTVWLPDPAWAGAPASRLALAVGALPPQDVMALADGGAARAIDSLPAVVEEVMRRSGVPGMAVAVVHGGRTVLAQGFGVRRRGEPDRVDADTVFQVASLSKPVSGSLVAIQVGQGVVSWGDPARRHLPALTLSDPYVSEHVSIGDLFAHRSGLPGTAGDELEDIGYGRDEILQRLQHVPLGPFRTQYAYANFGMTLGAEAVAAAAGSTWETLADTALFAPLGMSSSSYRHADFIARANRAALHAYVDGQFQPLYQRQPDAQAAAGGLSSTARDLAVWMRWLLAGGRHEGRDIVPLPALLPAISPQVVSAPPMGPDARAGHYGFGFNVTVQASGRPALSHSGAFLLGAATSVQLLPSADVGIVVLTNGGPVGAAEAVSSHFMDVVQYGGPTRDWFALYQRLMAPYHLPTGDLAGAVAPVVAAAAAMDPQSVEAYVGTYDNDYYGQARVERDGDALALVLGPAGVRMPMVPWGGEVHALMPEHENAPSGSRYSLRFERKSGRVVGFHVPEFDQHGWGRWQRRD